MRVKVGLRSVVAGADPEIWRRANTLERGATEERGPRKGLSGNGQTAISNSKMLCYTLYCTTVVLVHLLQSSVLSHSTMCTHLVAGVGVGLPLGDDHGLEVLTLGHLGLNLLDVLGEVGCVLQAISPSARTAGMSCSTYILGLGPLLLGQELVGHGQLRYLSPQSLISNFWLHVPGKRGADGRHGRKPPGVGGA